MNVQSVFGLNFGDTYDNNITEDNNDNYFHHSIGVKYSFGGSSDRDGDGVSDDKDRCPDIAGPKSTMGCPDTDMDGIVDLDDYCPTLAGVDNNNGCPVIDVTHIEVMAEALYGIYFDTEKAIIKNESFAILSRIVTIMENNEYYKLSVHGHTDSAGETSFNQKLSEDRSAAVKNYLVLNGIASDRIMATGYGESSPIATNDTEEGKALNRRVEFTLSY